MSPENANRLGGCDQRLLSKPEQALLEKLQLPADYAATIRSIVDPLCEQLAKRYASTEGSLMVGINGPQGSGKSSLCAFIECRMAAQFGLSTAVISLDDLYHTQQTRCQLAQSIHPLFQTRGVPGTHDIDLAVKTLQQLAQAETGDVTAIPRFNKALDDRFPESGWDHHMGRADLMILEGWCVAAQPQTEQDLIEPINRLELEEDPEAMWRRHVNQQLHHEYPRLFCLIDYLVYLQIPCFAQVHQWRRVQEQKLQAKQDETVEHSCRIGCMDEAALSRFIMHFERLTRFMMQELPDRADAVFTIERETNLF